MIGLQNKVYTLKYIVCHAGPCLEIQQQESTRRPSVSVRKEIDVKRQANMYQGCCNNARESSVAHTAVSRDRGITMHVCRGDRSEYDKRQG